MIILVVIGNGTPDNKHEIRSIMSPDPPFTLLVSIELKKFPRVSGFTLSLIRGRYGSLTYINLCDMGVD